MTILQSEKLTSLMKDLANQQSRVPAIKAEVLRLTNLLRDDSYGTTVINRERPASTPSIDMAYPENTANRTTGISDAEIARRKKDDLERALRNEPIAAQPDIKSQLDLAHRQWHAIEDAIDFLSREIEKEKYILAVQYCKERKLKHDEDMKRMFKALIEVHAAQTVLNDGRQHLIDDQIGLRGVYLTMPTFLDNPRNKWSEMGDFFREGKRLGYIDSIPASFQ